MIKPMLWSCGRTPFISVTTQMTDVWLSTCVPEAGINGMDKYLHPTYIIGCNYFSLSLIPVSGTQVTNCVIREMNHV